MTSRSVLYSALVSAIILASLHFLASTFYFYWIYWWFDVFMHFWAGVSGGLATYWVLFRSGHFYTFSNTSTLKVVWRVFLVMLVAGVAWEVFEYMNGMTQTHEGYELDTFNDLVLDSLGAIIAVLLASRFKNLR